MIWFNAYSAHISTMVFRSARATNLEWVQIAIVVKMYVNI